MKKALSRLLVLGTSLLLLFGCKPPLTAKRTVAKVGSVELARGADFQILPLGAATLDGTYNQKITGVFQGQRQTFLSQVEIDSNKMTMVGLAPFGARIFTLNYLGQTLDFATIPQLSSRLLPRTSWPIFNWSIGPSKPSANSSTRPSPKRIG